MKKLLILFLAPILMATQCEEDELFVTTAYVIQNDTSIDLIYLTEAGNEIVIASGTSFTLNGGPNAQTVVTPEDYEFVTEVKLYKTGDNEDLFLAYEQNPIQNELWVLNELGPNEFEYILVITDDVIN